MFSLSVMEAHNTGKLGGGDDMEEDDTETTTDTVGASRRKPTKKRTSGIPTGKFDLNAPTTKQPRWDPTSGKPIAYNDLTKGFYDAWAPLNEEHLREITALVDEAVIERKHTVKDMIGCIAEIKTLNTIRDNLMLLAADAHTRFSDATSLESSPAYRELKYLKKTRYHMQEHLKTVPGGFENDTYNADATLYIPYLDEFGFPIPKEKKRPGAPECSNPQPSKFWWEHEMTYGKLDEDIKLLEKKMDTFSFPKPEQDWEKFCECFPQAREVSELRSLLKVMCL